MIFTGLKSQAAALINVTVTKVSFQGKGEHMALICFANPTESRVGGVEGVMTIADEVWMIVRLLMICNTEAEGSQTCVTSRQQMAARISAQYSSTTFSFFNYQRRLMDIILSRLTLTATSFWFSWQNQSVDAIELLRKWAINWWYMSNYNAAQD